MAITMLAGYLVIINAAALLMMAEDKRMYLFHHKTKHWYFVVGMPLILAAQLAAGVWLAGNSGLV